MPKANTEIRALARAHTETAIRTLAGIMRQKNAPAAARVAAATSLLDRGWGKPTQPVGGDPDNPLRMVSIIELVGRTADEVED